MGADMTPKPQMTNANRKYSDRSVKRLIPEAEAIKFLPEVCT